MELIKLMTLKFFIKYRTCVKINRYIKINNYDITHDISDDLEEVVR